MRRALVATISAAFIIVGGVVVMAAPSTGEGITIAALHSSRDGRTDSTHGRYHVTRRGPNTRY